MSESQKMATGLWNLLAEQVRLRAVWKQTREECDRRAMAAAWSIAITAPGDARSDDGEPLAGRWTRCTPTVLYRDRWPRWPHLEYRGACLGCGWVSSHTHLIGDGGENAAVEDAHDHTHPGWRQLQVVGGPPAADAPADYQRQLDRWRQRWEPLLPAGWLDSGGPIRTHRTPPGGRHVPERAPGGGYDIATEDREVLGGQLGLF